MTAARTLPPPTGVQSQGGRTEHAPLPADADLPGPVAGFVGRINHRTDLQLLEAIADRGRSLLLVGPRDAGYEPRRFDALRRRRNVRWVGPKPSAALPGFAKDAFPA